MSVRNIVAFRNDRFGEFLLNIPAFRSLKEAYGQAKLTLVVDPYAQELSRCIEGVDEAIAWENRRRKFGEILQFSAFIKKKKFDLCVVFNPSKASHIASFLAGIPVRVGYARKFGFLLNHTIRDKKSLGEKHEVEYNLDLASLAGGRSTDKSLSLKLDPGVLARMSKKAGASEGIRLVAVHPWTSDPVKQWPSENFFQLTRRLAEHKRVKVVIVGGKDELSKDAARYDGLENTLNLTGKTSLIELAALLKNCSVLISGDSGPVHLARCVNAPVIALFSNVLPGKGPVRWGPWGDGNSVIAKPSLSDITVDEVLERLTRRL